MVVAELLPFYPELSVDFEQKAGTMKKKTMEEVIKEVEKCTKEIEKKLEKERKFLEEMFRVIEKLTWKEG